MTTFKTLASIGLLLATLSPVLAMDEYQSYERVCTGLKPLDTTGNAVGFKQCDCDFSVRSNRPNILVSRVNKEKKQVVYYVLQAGGKKDSVVLEGCSFTQDESSNWICEQDITTPSSTPYYLSSITERSRDTIVSSLGLVEKKTKYRFINSYSGIDPMYHCYKKKGIFDFKMPWK